MGQTGRQGRGWMAECAMRILAKGSKRRCDATGRPVREGLRGEATDTPHLTPPYTLTPTPQTHNPRTRPILIGLSPRSEPLTECQ